MATSVMPSTDQEMPPANDHEDGTPQEDTPEMTAQGMDSPIEHLQVAHIQIPPTARADWESLDVLQASLQTTGLLHPIIVKRQGDTYEVLAGHNRLQAAKNLGWTTIPARILEFTAHNALLQELVVLDENLCRDELNHLEYAEALGRAKQIYVKLYPRTGHGKGRTKQNPENGSCESAPQRPAFLDDKARQLGWSRSKLGEYLYIYRHLLPEVREVIRGHEMVNHLTQLNDLAHEEPGIQLAVARLLQREPQMWYDSAFEQACPQRAREKARKPWDDMFADTAENHGEPVSPENTSLGEAHDSNETYEQEEEGHEETIEDRSSSSQGPSAVHEPETQTDYVDPLQQRIDEAEKLHKEFYDISKMVTARSARTLDHVLNLISNYCGQFFGQRRLERKHNTITITFHPFPTPEEFKDTLPEGCPGWRLYCPKERVCITCPHQKSCFSAQVVPKEQRITQMGYWDYKIYKQKGKPRNTGGRKYRLSKKRLRALQQAKAKAE